MATVSTLMVPKKFSSFIVDGVNRYGVWRFSSAAGVVVYSKMHALCVSEPTILFKMAVISKCIDTCTKWKAQCWFLLLFKKTDYGNVYHHFLDSLLCACELMLQPLKLMCDITEIFFMHVISSGYCSESLQNQNPITINQRGLCPECWQARDFLFKTS